MKTIRIMLLTRTGLPTVLEEYAKTLDLDDAKSRVTLAEFCREHGRSRDEITAKTNTSHILYALATKANEGALLRTFNDGLGPYIGIRTHPSGYNEIKVVDVVEVDASRPWTIIATKSAENHTESEQVVYLDEYVDTGWNNFHAKVKTKPETNTKGDE